ncbi:MAG: hypothetical protein WDO19_01385 [Bacteroidota bacterium]
MKELALSGGAFVMAGSFVNEPVNNKNYFIRLLEKLIPAGRIFFSIMMIAFGPLIISIIRNSYPLLFPHGYHGLYPGRTSVVLPYGGRHWNHSEN